MVSMEYMPQHLQVEKVSERVRFLFENVMGCRVANSAHAARTSALVRRGTNSVQNLDWYTPILVANELR